MPPTRSGGFFNNRLNTLFIFVRVIFWKIMINIFSLLYSPEHDLVLNQLRYILVVWSGMGVASNVIAGMHRKRVNIQLILLKYDFTVRQ